jgi:alpha-D-ribose 1-methylphosphonate 5-triphosphate synthase subunit PhnL
MKTALELANVAKSFTMHLQGGVKLSVINGVSFAARTGECVVLAGPSGAGKSSILKMIFGSYRCDRGQIVVHHGQGHAQERTDIAAATPRQVLALRKDTIGYVSQFLRAIPRVPTLDVVAEPLIAGGVSRETARRKATELLRRLNIPGPLWGLPPATFSGGEQQRVNIARGFLAERPILLLDEPTASLDAQNSDVVMQLIEERKRRGAAIIAIVHDKAVRDRIADTVIDMTGFAAAA